VALESVKPNVLLQLSLTLAYMKALSKTRYATRYSWRDIKKHTSTPETPISIDVVFITLAVRGVSDVG